MSASLDRFYRSDEDEIKNTENCLIKTVSGAVENLLNESDDFPEILYRLKQGVEIKLTSNLYFKNKNFVDARYGYINVKF